MDTRALGRTGLRASLLGLGTGGANVFGQARGASAEEARALVRAALDLGHRLLRHRRGLSRQRGPAGRGTGRRAAP